MNGKLYMQGEDGQMVLLGTASNVEIQLNREPLAAVKSCNWRGYWTIPRVLEPQ